MDPTKSMHVVLLLIFASFVSCEDFQRREHSLVKPYQGSGLTMPNWDFTGSTVVSGNYVRLTPDLQSKQGALWNSHHCQFRNWELQIQFKVHGKGKDLFGDGFAIWYTKDRMVPGPVFGSKDYFTGLGIILDTYSNHNGPHNHAHPFISAMVNNGTLHYDHDRDGTHTQLAGCEAKFRNVDHDTYVAIRYENNKLTVSTDIDGKSDWKLCFMVEGVQLPTGYYFGMSAATGDLSDAHDVISVRMFELETSDELANEDRSKIVPSASVMEASREHVDDPMPSGGGLWTFLWLLMAVLVICALAVGGIAYYQKRQEYSNKHLY